MKKLKLTKLVKREMKKVKGGNERPSACICPPSPEANVKGEAEILSELLD